MHSEISVILRVALGLNTLCLRLAYVKTRKPDVSQLCADRVMGGGKTEREKRLSPSRKAAAKHMQRYEIFIRFANIFKSFLHYRRQSMRTSFSEDALNLTSSVLCARDCPSSTHSTLSVLGLGLRRLSEKRASPVRETACSFGW